IEAAFRRQSPSAYLPRRQGKTMRKLAALLALGLGLATLGAARGDDAAPTDTRVGDIRGDVVVGGQVQANWGLHLIDMNLFMGNFQDIVRREARAWLRKH